MLLTQEQYDAQSKSIYDKKRDLFKQINAKLASVENFTSEDQFEPLFAEISHLIEQLNQQDELHDELTGQFIQNGKLQVWVPEAVTIDENGAITGGVTREILLQNLKAPPVRSGLSEKELAIRKEEDDKRNETIAKLEQANTPEKFRAFLQAELDYYLDHTITTIEGTSDDFKKKVCSDVIKLMSTEAGVRLIIKRNEDHRIHNVSTPILNLDDVDLNALSRREREALSKSSSFKPSSNHNGHALSITKTYKAKKALSHGSGVIILDYKQPAFIALTIKNGKWLPVLFYLRENYLAHEDIHNKHATQGKLLVNAKFDQWLNNIPPETLSLFYPNVEEFKTVTGSDITTKSNASIGSGISEALILRESGNEIRASYEGFIFNANNLALSYMYCKIYNKYFEIINKFPSKKSPALLINNNKLCLDFKYCDTLTDEQIILIGDFIYKTYEYNILDIYFNNIATAKPLIEYLHCNKKMPLSKISSLLHIHGFIFSLQILFANFIYLFSAKKAEEYYASTFGISESTITITTTNKKTEQPSIIIADQPDDDSSNSSASNPEDVNKPKTNTATDQQQPPQ